MKTIFKLIALILLPLGLWSCSSDEHANRETYSVTYSAVQAKGHENLHITLKGSYIDAKGQEVQINEQLPFTITIDNMPESVRPRFKGVLYNPEHNVYATITMIGNSRYKIHAKQEFAHSTPATHGEELDKLNTFVFE